MLFIKKESFFILDEEINILNQKISYIDKKNAELKLNIFLTKEEEFFTLDDEVNELNQQIFYNEEKNTKLTAKIKILENDIKNLEKERKQKSWKLTFLNIFTFGIFKYYKNKNIDKQIKTFKINREDLKQKINENKNIIKFLKIKKLKIIKKTNILLKNLFFVNNRLIELNKGSIETIKYLQNQDAKIVIPNNNASLLDQNYFGYNNNDSDIEVLSESEQEDDSDIEVLSESEQEDDSDIEVLSESEQEDDTKIFESSYFNQNLINSLAKSSLRILSTLQKSILIT